MSEESKICFVISPIGAHGSTTRERADRILNNLIAPASRACGFEPIRADQISDPGLITNQVIQHIINDPIVIADLTGANPNVFYELAIRHSIRKPLVQIIEKDDKIPFDVAGMRTIVVDPTDPDNIETSKQEIQRQIKAVVNKLPQEIETPISAASGWFEKLWQSSYCPVRHREQLPKMNDWLPAKRAKDILMIGINLNLVFRQRPFFEAKLAEKTQLRLVIADQKDHSLVDIIKRGIEEKEHLEPDFGAFIGTITALRQALPDEDKSLIDLRFANYVPTLSYQVLDGWTNEESGTILVELAPNKVTVPERPHFILEGNNQTHRDWYHRFLNSCKRIYNDAKQWPW